MSVRVRPCSSVFVREIRGQNFKSKIGNRNSKIICSYLHSLAPTCSYYRQIAVRIFFRPGVLLSLGFCGRSSISKFSDLHRSTPIYTQLQLKKFSPKSTPILTWPAFTSVHRTLSSLLPPRPRVLDSFRLLRGSFSRSRTAQDDSTACSSSKHPNST